ncbi:NADH-quinone oxidoreductase subunit NuoN [Acidianus brierleyi]|uniref:NADH-quinone oxidoreductase subunit NuoN n=1 Tax=Acidianus brierleyi TaxID=41673 RepID=UPI0014438203|nr:NADH-quinone oxidoreductase subunit NuoN [Acidianus brierleyi]QIJ32841.1 NADH-quinone oxidoreductase subunit NuoN [Acidianus brierleyi]
MYIDYIPIVLISVLLLFSSISVLFIDKGEKKGYSTGYFLTLSSFIVVLIVLLYFLTIGPDNYYIFSYSLYISNIGYLLSIVAVLGGLVALLGAKDHMEIWRTRSSMLSLMMLTMLGIIYMAFSNNIIVILTGWGISSAASYAITMLRKDFGSVISGMKYLVMGLISSSFMIFGFALYALGIGTLYFSFQNIQYPDLFTLGIVFVSVAFLFKIGAFPFQGWLPDVYIDADRISVSFVSSVGKMVGIVPLLKILISGDPTGVEEISVLAIFATISILSMTIGNIVAFSRKDITSIFSFSSIAQMGFVLIGFTTIFLSQTIAEAGIIIQMMAYVIAQAGLFNFANHVEKVSGTTDIRGLRGLASSDRGLAVASTILLLSLLGIPPILGFWGKLFLFESAFYIPWLIVIGVINSAISAGYYVPLIREMYREGNFTYVRSDERDSVIFASAISIAVGLIAPLLLVVI